MQEVLVKLQKMSAVTTGVPFVKGCTEGTREGKLRLNWRSDERNTP